MIIGNRYKTISLLGSGGMGQVFKAQDLHTNKVVAVKTIPKNQITPSNLKRFQNEIVSMMQSRHQNIVKILNYSFKKDDYFIVQELVDGFDLAALIEKRVFFEAQEAVWYVMQILKALGYIHSKQILHRDIKPQNILITHTGVVKICDFGLARDINQNLNITKANALAGTPYYIAPEVWKHYPQSRQSEIYSTGIILYELLTGRKPFVEDQSQHQSNWSRDVLQKATQMPLPQVKNPSNPIPQALENVIIKATAKRPEERYKKVEEMANDLSTVFDKSRQNEPRHQVTNKFRAVFSKNLHDSSIKIKEKFKLPISSIIFTIILLILLVGVFVYAS